MEDLDKVGLKLLFDEDIYIIKEDRSEHSASNEINKEPTKEASSPPILEEPKEEITSLNYKGGNNKRIAIIINDDSNEYLNNTDEALLLNILKALGLSLDGVAIINQLTSGITWQGELEYSKVIVFGILPSTYSKLAEKYTIQSNGDSKWLFSDSLFALGNDKALKGKLWTSLQELFK